MFTTSFQSPEELMATTQHFYAKGLHQQDPLVAKKQLLAHGHSELVVDQVLRYIVASRDKVLSIVDYFEKHSFAGHSFQDMFSTLLERGIDSSLLAVAAGLYNHQSFY